jgi:hypothetical protein
MKRFEVVSPDGRKFDVDAPDGATQEDAIKYVQDNFYRSRQPVAKPDAPFEDPGTAGAFALGMGRTGDRLWKGVKQPFLEAGSAMGIPQAQQSLAQMTAEVPGDNAAYAPVQKKYPWASLAGEVAPLIAAPVLGRGVVGAMTTAAIPGMIEYGTPEERATRGAAGAAGGLAGGAIANVAGRIAQPIRNAASDTMDAAKAAAERLGVKLRAGELAQSRPLRWLESTLNDLPFASGMAQKEEAARRAAINQAGARSLGQSGNEITPQLLAKAREDTGSTFNSILQNKKILLDNQFRADVQNVAPSKVMKELRDEGTDQLIDQFKNLPPGNIRVSGEWFQQNKTALDAAIRGAYTKGENGKAMALEAFEDALVEAAGRSMTAQERSAFQTAQKQWATLRLLETGQVVEAGNIMPGRLNQAMTARYKAGYKEGKIPGDLTDIGTLAQTFKPLPQSGTAPRAFYSGGALAYGLSNPIGAGVMMAAPPLAQKFLQSEAGKKYLTQGLLNVNPEVEKWLIRSGGGLLGLPYGLSAAE